MSTVKLNEDTERYIKMFYAPEISSYQFLKCFFAQLYMEGLYEISRDLSEFFYEMKKDIRYREMLLEIKFRNNGVYKYSNELEDDILTLQNMGLLGKKNPSFGAILIQYNDEIANEALNMISNEYRELVKELVKAYKERNCNT